jgi:hypothetical protein
MDTYRMKPREIPLEDSWDVVVAGGGPAGCAAAAAAAREGARTLLVEATGCLGGMGTSGLVPAWCPFSDKEKMIYRGLAEKVFTACKAGMAHVRDDAMDWVPIDPELLKRIYDDLVTEAGATVRFHTTLAGVEMGEAGTVDAILLAGKARLAACRAKVYVDCTGDGDLAAWAGAPYEKGATETGELQPATLCFILSNVDTDAYERMPRHLAADSPIYRIARSDKYPEVVDAHFCNNVIGPGTVGFNAGHLWDVDPADPDGLSRAMIDGRRIARAFRDGLAELAPEAFGEAFLAATAPLMGVRETRRILGDYVLTLDDYLARRTFDDEICRNCYFIDIHTARDEIARSAAGEHVVERRHERYAPGESHGIPYRCLTPRGLVNVLVAGRAISCDRAVQGSVRVMPVCLAMGEAAGIAAASACALPRCDVHAVDAQHLRRRLREEGAYLPE